MTTRTKKRAEEPRDLIRELQSRDSNLEERQAWVAFAAAALGICAPAGAAELADLLFMEWSIRFAHHAKGREDGIDIYGAKVLRALEGRST